MDFCGRGVYESTTEYNTEKHNLQLIGTKNRKIILSFID